VTEVCYNVQSTVDEKFKLPIDYQVTNNNDKRAMTSMVDDEKMLNFAEKEGQIKQAEELLPLIRFMDIHTGRQSFEDYAKENIYSYTSEPKAIERAKKI